MGIAHGLSVARPANSSNRAEDAFYLGYSGSVGRHLSVCNTTL